MALFSLPRLIQGHDQSLGRHNDSEVPDRDAISEGSWWIRDDCGYGWSIVSRRRATFIALAYFLNLCPAQETYALNRMHVDLSGHPFVHNMQKPAIQLIQPPGFGHMPDPRSIPSIGQPPVDYVGYTFTKHPIEYVGQKET